MAQNQGAGPIPLAAHTQHPGLHMLFGVVAVRPIYVAPEVIWSVTLAYGYA
jgi:hypothetical protein